MAIQTLNDARIYLAEFDLSGDHNKIELEVGVNESGNTVFGNTAESLKGTREFVTLAGQGFVTLGAGTGVHDTLTDKINIADVPVTIAPDGAVEGTYAEFFKASIARYKPFDGVDVGEHMAFAFSANGQGTQPVQGTIVGSGSKTSTGNTAQQELGATTSTTTIYAVQHVLSVSGTDPTLDTIIQHDVTGFGTPTLALTFAQKTAVGSEFVEDSTFITSETFWRAKWTIGGTDTPTFNIVVVFGIESHA